MRKNKILALILAVSMVFTMMSMVSNVNAEGEIITVNVAPGESYTLPETVNEVMVTSWSPATVDTSKVGYKLYTGTFEDGTTVTYRINVGEYVQKYDLLAPYSVGDVAAKIAANGEGYTGSYHDIKKGDAWLRVYKDDSNTIEVEQYDSDTKALRLGPDGTSSVSFVGLQTTYKSEYKLNARFKLSGITLSEEDLLVGRWDIGGDSGSTPLCRILVYVTKDGFVRLNSANGVASHNGSNDTSVKLQSDGSTPWFDVSYRIYDSTWSIAVNGEDILVDKSFFSEKSAMGLFKFSPQDYTAGDKTLTYCTDITVDAVRYFEGELPESVTDTIAQGDAAEQTTTVALNMSDGNTKDFTVNYTADTSSAGSKTANGTIDGFDGTIIVNYKVIGVNNTTVNTYIGADISSTIPDADTSVFGKKYYTVKTDDAITNYTVNTGEFVKKYSDNMESHTNGEVTSGSTTYENSVIPGTAKDGLTLSLKYYSTQKPATVETVDGTQAIMMDSASSSQHVKWETAEKVSMPFKVNVKLRAKDYTETTTENESMFSIYNANGSEIFRALLMIKGSQYKFGIYRSTSASTSTEYFNSEVTTAPYDTGWINLEIIGKEDNYFDVYINGKRAARSGYDRSDWPSMSLDAEMSVGAFYARNHAGTAAKCYIDDITVSEYVYFNGTLPQNEEIVIGQGETSSEISLTVSNGSTRKAQIALNSADTSRIGTAQAEASVIGFDDKITVNARVCNFIISDLSYNEGKTSLLSAKVANKGSISEGQAVFVWYNSSNEIENIKLADISGIAKNAEKTIDVNLDIPILAADGYLKVFTVNSLGNLVATDFAAQF